MRYYYFLPAWALEGVLVKSEKLAYSLTRKGALDFVIRGENSRGERSLQ